MSIEQKWLAHGGVALVIDAGNGEPGDEDYRPALVAALPTEYVEPAQIMDADPLAEATEGTVPGATTYPGEISGPTQPTPAPQAIPGPATPVVTTRSTASEDPRVTAPGSPAHIGTVSAAQMVATIRDLERRAHVGDADAQRELSELNAAFDEDYESAGAGWTGDRDAAPTTAPAGVQPGVNSPQGDADGSPQADTPSTQPGGNGEAAGSADGGPAGATGASGEPAPV